MHKTVGHGNPPTPHFWIIQCKKEVDSISIGLKLQFSGLASIEPLNGYILSMISFI